MKMILEILNLIIILIIGVGVPLISLLVFNKRAKKFDAMINKNHFVYENKVKTIKEALHAVDIFFSYLKIMNTDGTAQEHSFREEMTQEELTIWARKIYNDLAICCNNEKILNLFISLFSDSGKNKMKEYTEFRNCCRDEMELMSKIEFDPDRVFIGRIFAKDLPIQKPK